MGKSNYQKIEGILYRHYSNKLKRDRYKRKIVKLEKQKEDLKKDIYNCNIEFNTTIRAMDYSSDKIVCNSIDSSMDQDIEKGISRLINQYKSTIRLIINTKRRLREVESLIDNIDIILEELTEEEQQLIELKYGDKKSYREMEEYLPISLSTISRFHKKTIEYLEGVIL